MSTQIDLFVYCFSTENIFVHRPIAGSLTEARGQRANIHVFKEMLELCEIINSEGFSHCKETPKLKVILFGELFNVRHGKHNLISFYAIFDRIFEIVKQIYTCINDKLVGLLLRARKYKFVDFEGGMLYQYQ